MRTVTMVRKPLAKASTTLNCLENGTGAFNIQECRIQTSLDDDIHAKTPHTKGGFGHSNAQVYGSSEGAPAYNPAEGRWPANVVLSMNSSLEMDRKSGFLKTGRVASHSDKGIWKSGADVDYSGQEKGGGASRFFKIVEDK